MAQKQPLEPGENVVISLTSYRPRFATLVPSLRSLLDQSVAVSRTVLWVAHEDAEHLPQDVTNLQDHGLEIRQCQDVRSYKKLIPALLEWPDATIITADDDLYYRQDWALGLIEASRAHPGKIIGRRMHLAPLDAQGALTPYNSWIHASDRNHDDHPGGLLFPTGSSGILYPPNSLHEKVTDDAAFMRICPAADDVWFFWMAKLKGSKYYGLGDASPLITWDGSQEEGLFNENLAGGNDRQIEAMTREFGKPWLESKAPAPSGTVPAPSGMVNA